MLQIVDSGINQAALNEFIEYRAEEFKKPMSDRAIVKAKNILLKYPSAHQQHLVDVAILYGWIGLFHRDMPQEPSSTSSRNTDIRDDLTDRSWANR